MIALNVENLLNLILCIYGIKAYRQSRGRIVTPIGQQTGGMVSNQSFTDIIMPMFPPNNNNENNIVPTASTITEAPPVTQAIPTSPNGGGNPGNPFPTSINIFLNITSGNGFGFTISPSIDVTTETTPVLTIAPTIPSNGAPSDVGIISPGGGGNTEQQPAQVIENKMIFEEKCEEYYNMGSRKTRKAQVQVFIVGGTNSLPKEFPHMAALGYGTEGKKEWLCGGSLVSENYVITAAHCLASKTLGDVQSVRLGTTILQTETLDSVDYAVVKRIAHPDYGNDQYNDIALLQLDRPVKFSDSITPICLYSNKDIGQKKLIATGWGKTESAGDVSPELQKVELEYFSNSECQLSYAVISKQDLPLGIVDETQICAGSRSEEKDTCQGDSGGPLQFQDNERMYLVGITSFGIGCGRPGNPGVYTRVSYFIPWIQKIVWGK